MKQRLSLFLVVLLLVVSAAGAAPAFAQETTPNKSPFAPIQNFFRNLGSRAQQVYLRVVPGDKNGEAVLGHMLQATAGVTSVNFDSSTSVEAKKNGENVFSLKFDADGPTQITSVYDPKTTKQQLDLAGEIQMQGTSLRARADVIVDGSNFYFKLNEVPAIPLFDLNPLKGEWLRSNLDVASTESPNQPTAEQRQQLQQASLDLFKSADVSQARKEKKNDVSVFVIDINFEDEAIATYMKRVAEINQDADSAEPAMTAEEEQDMREFLDATEPITATVWVNQNNFYLRHLELPLTIDAKKLQESSDAAAEDEETQDAAIPQADTASPFGTLTEVDTLMISVTADFDKHNEPVTITAPESARDAQEAFQEVMTDAFGGTFLLQQQSAIEAQQRATEQQLQMQKRLLMPPTPGRGPKTDDLFFQSEIMLEEYGY